jgi:hypothetical protein
MNRQQRQALLIRLEDEGKTNENHTFLVKSTEKRKEKQYWVPVSGAVISMFLSGDHEYRYLGPSESLAVKTKIAEIDLAQAHIVGERTSQKADSFVVDVDLEDLGLEEAPKTGKKPQGKKDNGD